MKVESRKAILLTFPLLTFAAMAGACEALPRDNFGTTERIHKHGVLRVGAAAEPPWVIVNGASVSGVEARLIEAFARAHGAQVQWSHGSQTALVERLHAKQIDVVIGGFDAGTPLHKRMALTQPYVVAPGSRKKEVNHVLGVMPGESRLLFALDSFLLENEEAKRIAASVGALP